MVCAYRCPWWWNGALFQYGNFSSFVLTLFNSIDCLGIPPFLAYYWSLRDLLSTFFITSVNAFSRTESTVRTRYSERLPGNKGRCIPRIHIHISLGWNGMAAGDSWPVPSTLLAWITLFDSPSPSLLQTDVVIGLLWGTRESTSFGIIASDESTALPYDPLRWSLVRVYIYSTVLEYCGHSVADNVIQLNHYYCLRWDGHVSVSSVIDNS